MSLRVAYLINQYPKVSHSFIRREIAALERLGVVVQRVAVRGWHDALADPEDLQERQRTRYLLQAGLLGLLPATLRCLLTRPRRFGSALALAWRMSRGADRALPYHLMYLMEACLLLAWLQQGGAQHVHAHFGTNGAEVAMLVAALGGPGYSFTVHGPEEFDKPLALGLAHKICNARFAVAISSYGRSQLYRWIDHAQWPKVQVVHCGLEADYFEQPVVPPPAEPRLVCVGRLCEQKGQLLLVQALAQLVARGVAVRLVLAGDGEMRADLEALIAQLGLQAHVSITGWISAAQVRAELLQARALVLPSFAEGLPVVIMEAMALHRPVLTTTVAGIPELLQHLQHGWLFAPGSVTALADAMAACLAASSAQLAAMGEAGHQRVRKRHAIDTEAARLAHLFDQAVRA